MQLLVGVAGVGGRLEANIALPGELPPLRPVNESTFRPISRATRTASVTFGLLPLVLRTQSTSPGRAWGWTWRAKNLVEGVVVADGGQVAGVGAQAEQLSAGAREGSDPTARRRCAGHPRRIPRCRTRNTAPPRRRQAMRRSGGGANFREPLGGHLAKGLGRLGHVLGNEGLP